MYTQSALWLGNFLVNIPLSNWALILRLSLAPGLVHVFGHSGKGTLRAFFPRTKCSSYFGDQIVLCNRRIKREPSITWEPVTNWCLCYALKFFIPHQDIKRLWISILPILDSAVCSVNQGSVNIFYFIFTDPWLLHLQPGVSEYIFLYFHWPLVENATTRDQWKYFKIYSRTPGCCIFSQGSVKM